MSFIAGSLTDSNPGPALYALMAPALTTAGFALVDTVTISTRTHKVWKSPAAGNVQNLDWYLDIGYTTTGAGTISLVAFEFYDPATDLGYRGPYVTSNNTIDGATSSRFGATGFTLENQWLNASVATMQAAITTAAFGYWISITTDRVVLLTSATATLAFYAGFYEPDPVYAAKAGAALFPLFTGQVGGTSTGGSAGLSRIAPWTALTGTGWLQHLTVNVPNIGAPRLPSDPTTSYPFSAARVNLTGFGVVLAGRYGWLRDAYWIPTIGVVRGDTVTIGGAQYVLTSTASGSYAFKAV